MKRHILSILLLSFLLISPQSYSKKIKWKKETVAVSGNCNMCKNKIEEAALAVEGVKSAKWNSTKEELKLKFDPAKANLENILKKVESKIY